MDVIGHAALVTGGGSGLGAATASALAAAGAKVALLDVNIDAAKAHAAKIGGIAIKCDVSDSDSAVAAVKEAREKHGVARVLINCAGIGTPKKILGRDGPQPLADFDRIIRVNLIGSFNVLRLFAADLQNAEALADGERGVCISTASVAAYEGQIGQAAYAASKGGIVGLTLPAARELAQFGIRVLAIAPGIFLTPMLLGLSEEVQQSLAASVPFPKLLGKPEQYASLAMEMVRNTYLNGEVVRIDGSLRMAPK
ncbi:MAG: SDR family NAD(P)-dependent oxidoreductase [Xanthobacteraceae bacterium]|nr:SDR family NAD(P)-dependent oxidoreductase [Xanthobacteraceae bacterium]MCW5678993.1 SDR family NAD(P)-dependent oxidoreductase [Xanthobacteraceae bacterium]